MGAETTRRRRYKLNEGGDDGWRKSAIKLAQLLLPCQGIYVPLFGLHLQTLACPQCLAKLLILNI
jgi:hypothetical protein